MFDVKSSADGEIQILGSRLAASRTVDALMLNVRAEPRYFPLIGRWIASRTDGLSDPGLFGMGGFDLGTESIQLVSFDVPRDLQHEQFKLVALANGRYELSDKGLTEPVVGAIGKTERFKTPSGYISLNVSGMAGHPGAAFILRSRSRQITTDDLIKSLHRLWSKASVRVSSRRPWKERILLFFSRTFNELGRQYVERTPIARRHRRNIPFAFSRHNCPS